MVLSHTPDGSPVAAAVVETCTLALELWHEYRDGVAAVMGLGDLRRNNDG
jgi:hypothetical protein